MARENNQAGVRVAVDIGGTFTDIVLMKPDGVLAESKVSTTPTIRATPWSRLPAPLRPQIGGQHLGIRQHGLGASTVAGNPVTEADERAKLALVVEAAKTIWSKEPAAASSPGRQQQRS